jgi:uncharacterized integral membrane protein
MIIFFILGLLLGGVTVIFALQNVSIITVMFFKWQLTGSLALVLMSAIAAGVFATLLVLLPENIRSYFAERKLLGEIDQLKDELHKQKTLTHFAKIPPPSAEVIDHIDRESIIPPPQNQIM